MTLPIAAFVLLAIYTPSLAQEATSPFENAEDDPILMGYAQIFDNRTTHVDKAFYPEKEMRYIVYTNDRPGGYSMDIRNTKSVLGSPLRWWRPTYVTIHGWMGDSGVELNVEVRRALIEKNGTFNLIVVDWSGGSGNRIYPIAAGRVGAAGRQVGKMLAILQRRVKLNLDKVTVVGFSLGAHVAGFAGGYLRGALGAIVGLDPAGPGFQGKSAEHRLDRGDAKYVQVIHTQPHPYAVIYFLTFFKFGLGIRDPIGHANFYTNFHRDHQNGCRNIVCDHHRAWAYYAESLVSKTGFHARRCRDSLAMKQNMCGTEGEPLVLMGGERLEETQGLFLVNTYHERPFAKGK